MASNEAQVIRLPGRGQPRDRKVVAIVLDDGTVRRTDGEGPAGEADWNSGQITGDDWVLWWQRRAFPSQ